MSDVKNINKYNQVVVEGVLYSNENEAKRAIDETKGIKVVRQRADLSDPFLVLDLYNKMLQKEMFTTVNGYAFMLELQNTLYQSEEISNSVVKPIPSPNFKKKAKQLKKENPYRTKFIYSLILIGILLIAMVVMFIITANSSNLNIINYRARLQAEYEEKENELAIKSSELRQREAAVRERENALEESENADSSDASDTTDDSESTD